MAAKNLSLFNDYNYCNLYWQREISTGLGSGAHTDVNGLENQVFPAPKCHCMSYRILRYEELVLKRKFMQNVKAQKKVNVKFYRSLEGKNGITDD